MTQRHSPSHPPLAAPIRRLRLIERKRAKPELPPTPNGIRPTRTGPWDPCRFQEYELSPEFRRAVMLAKLPRADPTIFRDTLPPAKVTEPDGVPSGVNPLQTVPKCDEALWMPPPLRVARCRGYRAARPYDEDRRGTSLSPGSLRCAHPSRYSGSLTGLPVIRALVVLGLLIRLMARLFH